MKHFFFPVCICAHADILYCLSGWYDGVAVVSGGPALLTGPCGQRALNPGLVATALQHKHSSNPLFSCVEFFSHGHMHATHRTPGGKVPEAMDPELVTAAATVLDRRGKKSTATLFQPEISIT